MRENAGFKTRTLNQLFKSLRLLSSFRSPWSFSNKADKTENGAVSLFCGGGGKLVSISVDGALTGVGYESWDSAEDMVATGKMPQSRRREMTLIEERDLRTWERFTESPDLRLLYALDLNLDRRFLHSLHSHFNTDYDSAGGFLSCSVQTMATEDPFNSLQRRKTHDPSMIGLWKIGRTIGKGSSGLSIVSVKTILC